jgi:hypothetical protein
VDSLTRHRHQRRAARVAATCVRGCSSTTRRMSATRHQLVRLRARPDTRYLSRGRTVLATTPDGTTRDGSAHGPVPVGVAAGPVPLVRALSSSTAAPSSPRPSSVRCSFGRCQRTLTDTDHPLTLAPGHFIHTAPAGGRRAASQHAVACLGASRGAHRARELAIDGPAAWQDAFDGAQSPAVRLATRMTQRMSHDAGVRVSGEGSLPCRRTGACIAPGRECPNQEIRTRLSRSRRLRLHRIQLRRRRIRIRYRLHLTRTRGRTRARLRDDG